MIKPGPTLRNFRKLHGYRQKDLADALHMTVPMISLWEREQTPITFEHMQTLLEFMGYELKIMKKKEDNNGDT